MEHFRPYGDSELISLLTSAGLLEDFNAGKLLCAFCGTPLNRENIGILIHPYRGFSRGAASCRNKKCIDEIYGSCVLDAFDRPNAKR